MVGTQEVGVDRQRHQQWLLLTRRLHPEQFEHTGTYARFL